MRLNSEDTVLEVTAKTDKGLHREGNEDNFIVAGDYSKQTWILPNGPYTNQSAGTILVVADGMGGLNAGEVASKIAISSIQSYFMTLSDDDTDVKHGLLNAMIGANNDIVAYGEQHPETTGMGSTVVMALIKENVMHVAWLGDSRCYVWRQNNLLQLSKDHSHVQTLVDAGKLTKDQAFDHPDSNIITQSLGDARRKLKPGYEVFTLYIDDIVMLCTDGLNGMLRDDNINGIISENSDLPDTADKLIAAANKKGGIDNITVVMCHVLSAPGSNSNVAHIPLGEKETIKKRPVIALLLLALLMLSCAAFFVALHHIKAVVKPKSPDSAAVKPVKQTSPPVKKTNSINDAAKKTLKEKLKVAAPVTGPLPSDKKGRDTSRKNEQGNKNNLNKLTTDPKKLLHPNINLIKIKKDTVPNQ